MIGFFLLIFYTRYLSPAEYGLIELILVLFSLLNLILPLEITQGVARFFSDASNIQKSKIISTSISFTAIVFLVPVILALFIPETLSNIFFGSELERSLVILVFNFMLFYALVKLLENQLRWSLQPSQFAILSMFGSLTLAIFPVTFIYFLDLGLAGFVYGSFIASAVSMILGLYLIKISSRFNFKIYKQQLVDLLTFSSPLVLSSAAFYIFTYSDRWMLQLIESSESVGVYGASTRLASIAALFHVLSRYAFMPLVYSSYKEKDTSEAIGKIFTLMTIFGVFLISLIFIFSHELVGLILGNQFQKGSELVGYLSISIILMNTYFFFPGLNIAKKTRTIAGISVFVALINILGNYFLIHSLSMKGAALSSLLASFVMVYLYFSLGQKEYKIKFNFSKILIYILLVVTMVLIQQIVLENNFMSKIFISSLSFILFLFFSKGFFSELNSSFNRKT